MNRYANEAVVQDAMVVVAGWIADEYGIQVKYHNGTAVDADIFKGIIRIPKMSCSSGINKEALMLLRGRVYHEAGHIGETKLTKAEYPGFHINVMQRFRCRLRRRHLSPCCMRSCRGNIFNF